MNTSIKVISGPVGKGQSKKIAEFLKCSPDQIMRIETPPDIFFKTEGDFRTSIFGEESSGRRHQ